MTEPSITDGLISRMYPGGTDGDDPVSWIERVLGVHLWSKQREILQSVACNRQTAVQAGHGVGKSVCAACLVAWWGVTHLDDLSLVTAPTSSQIEAVMFRNIKRLHAAGDLPGYITDGAVPKWKIDGRLVALGRKSQDLTNVNMAEAAFQGLHSPGLLAVIDEAAGCQPWLWESVRSLGTSDESRMLAIGNPTDPSSEFAEVCKPGSGWNVIKISVFDTPAFTGEPVPSALLKGLVGRTWVEEAGRRWGEGTPMYTAKVLGEFPDVSEDSLISPTWVQDAQLRDLSPKAQMTPAVYGVDVARMGPDETVAYCNRGGHIRLAHKAHGQNLTHTTGAVVRLLRSAKGSQAVIDSVGIGVGVFDRLREQGLSTLAYQGSERARRPDRFVNRRAESFWLLREEFQAGRIDLDPADEELAAQLLSIQHFEASDGRIQIESKAQMKKRGIPSPDRADALAMTMGIRSSSAESWLKLTQSKPTAVSTEERDYRRFLADGPDAAEIMRKDW